MLILLLSSLSVSHSGRCSRAEKLAATLVTLLPVLQLVLLHNAHEWKWCVSAACLQAVHTRGAAHLAAIKDRTAPSTLLVPGFVTDEALRA